MEQTALAVMRPEGREKRCLNLKKKERKGIASMMGGSSKYRAPARALREEMVWSSKREEDSRTRTAYLNLSKRLAFTVSEPEREKGQPSPELPARLGFCRAKLASAAAWIGEKYKFPPVRRCGLAGGPGDRGS